MRRFEWPKMAFYIPLKKIDLIIHYKTENLNWFWAITFSKDKLLLGAKMLDGNRYFAKVCKY
jgi:hypothetical protein